eukprot:10738798-Alexandrium_andersonii.AAC.1
MAHQAARPAEALAPPLLCTPAWAGHVLLRPGRLHHAVHAACPGSISWVTPLSHRCHDMPGSCSTRTCARDLPRRTRVPCPCRHAHATLPVIRSAHCAADRARRPQAWTPLCGREDAERAY